MARDLNRRKNAEQSLWAFMHIYLKHYFTQACGDLQKELCRALEIVLLPVRFLVGALPREHGKSTLATTCLVIYCICRRLKSKSVGRGRTVGPYIRIWSATEQEAKQKLENIKAELEGNKDLRDDYGDDILPARDETGAFVRYNDLGIVLNNGAIVESRVFMTKARGMNYRGLRPTLDILDDPEDDQNVESAAWRDRAERWVNKALLNGLDSQVGSLVWLGTILHHDSVLMRMLHPSRGEKQDWARMFKQAPDPDLPESEDNKLLWPERWPMSKYAATKAKIGSAAYEQEYRNNPVDKATQDFRPEYWRFYDPDRLVREGGWGVQGEAGGKPIRFSSMVMACDPAFTLDKKSDYTAIVVLGVLTQSQLSELGRDLTNWQDQERLIYVLGIWRDKTSIGGIGRKMEEWNARFHPSRIGYETGAAQTSSRNQLASATILPIIGITPTNNKKGRIRALAGLFENRKILLPDPDKDPFTRQFIKEGEQFPSGQNDDMLDAMAMAVEMLQAVGSAGVDTGYEREPVGTQFGGF